MIKLTEDEKRQTKGRLKKLWYLSNPRLSSAVDKFIWKKDRRISIYTLLNAENEVLKYLWSVENPSEVSEFIVESHVNYLLAR